MKETKNKPNKFKSIIPGIVGAIIGAAITMTVAKYFFTMTSYDPDLLEKAIEINKSTPVMIDENTRFDFVNALPGNKFQYNFTFVNAMLGAIDTNAVKDFLKPNILRFAKSNPEMKFIRDKKTTLYYYYKDMNRNFLFKLPVLPEEYNKK